MPHHWGSLRVQLMLIVILATVPALGFTVYRTNQDRLRESISAQVNAFLVARLVNDEHERITRDAGGLLAELGRDPALVDRDAAKCTPRLADFLARNPAYANVTAFDPDGALFCSALPVERPENLGRSPWFRRALSSRDLVTGDYALTGASNESGQPMMLGIRSDTDAVRAVLIAWLDPEWLSDFVAREQIASGMTITLLDRASTVLARYPDVARWTGKTWVPPNLRLLLGQDRVVSEGQDLDGSSRLLASVLLGDPTGAVGSIIVGVPAEQAFAASTSNFWRTVAAIAVIAAGVLGITWFGDKLLVGRQVRALADATRAIASGREQIRTGLARTSGELGDLGASIDQMAEALERRDRERHDMEAALAESEERYRDLFENASDLILSVAPDGHILYANKAWRETLGFDGAPPADLVLLDMIDPEARPDAERMFDQVMAGERLDQIGLTLVARDRHKIEVEGSATCKYVNGRPQALQGIFRDVTSRKLAEARLVYLSSHDALTGLYNRGYFEEEMSRLSHSRQLPISIVVADVDGLKSINDTLGHVAGDELLKLAARVMSSSFRQEDLIARIGGDEFAVILPKSNEVVAEEAIRRVRQGIAAQYVAGATPRLHLSLGTATASSGDRLMETLTTADAAMYADKAAHQRS